MITEFTHHIPKEKEGLYYTVPFDVPDNIVKLTVSYDYYRGTKGVLADLRPTNTIDIGLMDEKGSFLGWSGSAHKSISVGEYGSSKGYLSQKINKGQWQIIVGAYHVVESGVDVKYTVEFEEKGELLLFGDLHIHSDASDGKHDIPTLGKKAKEKGLDFVGIANHNNYCENFSLPHIDDFTFIPAVEWTHYKGHMNFFGVNAPFENSFIANSKEEMKNIVEHARSLGAVVSVNHPKCSFCPYLWEDENSFDMVEVWNGPMRPTNIRGIAWWTELLKKGRKLPIVGGSDFHKEGPLVNIGTPVTAVITPSRSSDDILNSIKNGHSFVSESINGPRLFLEYNGTRLGDTAAYSKNEKLKIKAEKLSKAGLYLVTDNGEELICKGEKDTVEVETNITKTGFAYLKAVKGFGKLSAVCAISNPIYFD